MADLIIKETLYRLAAQGRFEKDPGKKNVVVYHDLDGDQIQDKVFIDYSQTEFLSFLVFYADTQKMICGVFRPPHRISLPRLGTRNTVRESGKTLPSCPQCAATGFVRDPNLLDPAFKAALAERKTYDGFIRFVHQVKPNILLVGENDHQFNFFNDQGFEISYYPGLSASQAVVLEFIRGLLRKGVEVTLVNEFAWASDGRPISRLFHRFHEEIAHLNKGARFRSVGVYAGDDTDHGIQEMNDRTIRALRESSIGANHIFVYYGGSGHLTQEGRLSLVPSLQKLGLRSVSASLIDQSYALSEATRVRGEIGTGAPVDIQTKIQFAGVGKEAFVMPDEELRSDGLGFAVNIPPGFRGTRFRLIGRSSLKRTLNR